MENKGEVLIYESADHQTQVEVKLEAETIWLTQKQIALLFGTQRPAITKHLKNIFATRELDEQSVSSILEHTAGDGKAYQTQFYSLDAIISVGYRVNSQRATQFRIWATQRLKDYLVRGYALNETRLQQLAHNLGELEQTVQRIRLAGDTEALQLTEARGLLEIIGHYTRSFVLLNQFDSHTLEPGEVNENITYEIAFEEAEAAIEELKLGLIAQKEATALFGNQKDGSFRGILGSIVQTFGGEYLYRSIEEQAANLLYLTIKNHPFSDGNKRIGAFLFVWFLEKNKHRFKKSGELKINDNALVALALLVAQSDPAEKELMIKLIMNLIDSRA
ncbi:MAG: virulence protein RhuM/Fic/DOC family protein [Saprospiraceae bacterium]|jgi:death-on-curing family protein|nr:virulence protein RhuM/Fic/DOC family protein [Saprospiraceae bacterium]